MLLAIFVVTFAYITNVLLSSAFSGVLLRRLYSGPMLVGSVLWLPTLLSEVVYPALVVGVLCMATGRAIAYPVGYRRYLRKTGQLGADEC